MAVGENEGEKRRPQLQAELQVIFSCCCGGGSLGAVVAALNMFWPVEVSSPVMEQVHRELGSSVTGFQHTAAGICFHCVEGLVINSANLVNF